jgi:hypothetical protein
VQQLVWRFEKIGLPLQVQPHEPVPFQGQAIGAQRIFARIGTAVRQKLAEMTAAHRTFDSTTPVKQGNDFHGKMTDQLQIFAWNVPDNKANDVFHRNRFGNLKLYYLAKIRLFDVFARIKPGSTTDRLPLIPDYRQ